MSRTFDVTDADSGFEEYRVAREGGSIYVRDYGGAGPAFVLMHGFPDNLHIYDALVPYLVDAGRRVVTFDFLGFGASDKPDGAHYSFRQQQGDLEAVVEALDLRRIIPVAHDSAGPCAVNFALDHPEQADAIVILNSVYHDAPTVKYPEFITLFATPSLKALAGAILRSPEQFGWLLNFQRMRFQAALKEEHRARYASFLGPIIDQNFRQKPSAAPAFAQMTGQLFEEVTRNSGRLGALAQLDIPVRLIWGESDPYLNIGMAEDLAAHLMRGSLHALQAGHWVQLDEAEQVAAIMLASRD